MATKSQAPRIYASDDVASARVKISNKSGADNALAPYYAFGVVN